MSKLKTLEVEVRPVLTVDENTAFTCLMLLELYCKANNVVLEPCENDPQSYDFRHIIKYGGADNECK